ncbi:MAG: energy transducer TonB [Candidatus Sulfotelmatobacter sp.]
MLTELGRDRVCHVVRGLSGRVVCLALALFVVATAAWAPSLLAQTTTPEESGRKLIATVKPEYPAALQHAQIGGLVRLSATVLANGTVSKVQIRGGNPVLAESAVAAVMKWRYAPGPAVTNEEVSVKFTPH